MLSVPATDSVALPGIERIISLKLLLAAGVPIVVTPARVAEPLIKVAGRGVAGGVEVTSTEPIDAVPAERTAVRGLVGLNTPMELAIVVVPMFAVPASKAMGKGLLLLSSPEASATVTGGAGVSTPLMITCCARAWSGSRKSPAARRELNNGLIKLFIFRDEIPNRIKELFLLLSQRLRFNQDEVISLITGAF